MGLTPMEWLWLAGQVVAGVLTARVWLRRVVPHAMATMYPALVLDVWGPVIACLPLLWLAGRADAMLGGGSWTPIGGPVALAGIGIGAALLLGRSPDDRDVTWDGSTSRTSARSRFALGAWAVAGVVLLLIAAAQELSVWIGQCLFAIAAVLMWMNTPGEGREGGDASSESSSRRTADASVGAGVIMAMLAALGHGYAGYRLGDSAPVAASVAALAPGLVIVLMGVRWGASSLVRMSGWTGTLGVFAGLGVLSVLTVLPDAWRLVVGRFLAAPDLSPPQLRVAVGTGRFAIEATLLVMMTGIAWVGLRSSLEARRGVGGVLLLASVALVVWRLSVMAPTGPMEEETAAAARVRSMEAEKVKESAYADGPGQQQEAALPGGIEMIPRLHWSSR